MKHALHDSALGKDVSYPDVYDPNLLFGLDRQANRESLTIPETWYGADIWNAYELSWLDLRGKPVVATARFVFPWNSPRLIESKSLKLYLNSFNQTRMDNVDAVRQRLERDLAAVAGSAVEVSIALLNKQDELRLAPLNGSLIDDLDVDIHCYTPKPGLLQCTEDAPVVSEVLTSNLLKSNCPVTGQPDWASVQIRYTGPAIDHAALLAYIVSLRQHSEFHEHCIEKMYSDIWLACRPTALTVYARYTRRGGLDINPWRASHPVVVDDVRTIRQ